MALLADFLLSHVEQWVTPEGLKLHNQQE